MTRQSPLWIGVRKEARALWPVWAASTVTLAAFALLGTGRNAELGWIGYFVGALTLAAVSVGHEYTYGTLPTLLSLPINRARLLAVKLGTAGLSIALLTAVAIAVLPSGPDFSPSDQPLFSWMCGLLMAPWLAMVCRSPLAGVVFAGGLTGQWHIVAELVLFARHGWVESPTPEQAALRATVIVSGLLTTGVLAGIAGPRRFMRLEAIDGRDPGIDLSRWLTARSSAIASRTRRHPLWLLVLKELRLQQLTLVVAVLFAAGWLTFSAIWRGDAEALSTLEVVGAIYYLALALLIGSLASAEERQLGTHEWQALLPIAGWRLWAIKAGTAIVLALVFAFGLPVLLTMKSGAITLQYAGTVVLLTSGGLFVSSLCRSGLSALTWSIPALVLGVLLLSSRFGGRLVTGTPLLAGALAASAIAALWFGFENHRLAASNASRVWWQVVVVAAAPIASVVSAQW